MAQAQQNLAVSQYNQANAAAAAVHQQQSIPTAYLDYATLAAAAAAAQNNTYGLHPAVSSATGLEHYGYQLGIGMPSVATTNASNNQTYAAHLTAAQAQLVAAASGAGHTTLGGDNARI